MLGVSTKNEFMIQSWQMLCRHQLNSIHRTKEGMGFYVALNSLGHIATTETQNREEITLSSRIALLVVEEPKTALHNAAHLYSDQAKPLEDPAEIGTCELTLGSQAS